MIKKYFDKLPYKRSYVVAAFAIWNLLFIPVILEIFKNYDNPDFGVKWLPPLIFAFFTSVVVLISKRFRREILKEGKTFTDIRKDVFLISILMLVFLLLQVQYIFKIF
ncbi:MAG: hypothetical protein Mars2KO_19410 [Maribacter sp.]